MFEGIQQIEEIMKYSSMKINVIPYVFLAAPSLGAKYELQYIETKMAYWELKLTLLNRTKGAVWVVASLTFNFKNTLEDVLVDAGTFLVKRMCSKRSLACRLYQSCLNCRSTV